MLTAICTDEFDDFIDKVIKISSHYTDPDFIALNYIPQKTVNQMTKQIEMAKKIRTLSHECCEIDDLVEAVHYVSNHYYDFPYFKIKRGMIKNDEK